ncbi:MAG TPA: DinB family protein [Acidimicrobiales bacterium]|nr:DinB family protein [Acidimicrobiales bacterium]
MADHHDQAGARPVGRRPELHVPRPDESAPADETTTARGWLTHLRESALYKLEDLDDEGLRWRPVPTANSLGSIVMHLAYAERQWFRAIFAGEPMDLSWRSHTFEVPDGWSADDVAAFYRAEVAAADAVLDGAASFDQASRADFRPTTLRWVVTHMLEETARHVGHMDLTRELLDGRTGR